ncbi:hypothetical protein ACSS6W_003506 [Trichoderma asperelloides]
MRPLGLVCDGQRLRHLGRNLSSSLSFRVRAKLIFHTPLTFQRPKPADDMSVIAASARTVLLLRPYDACHLPLLSTLFPYSVLALFLPSIFSAHPILRPPGTSAVLS